MPQGPIVASDEMPPDTTEPATLAGSATASGDAPSVAGDAGHGSAPDGTSESNGADTIDPADPAARPPPHSPRLVSAPRFARRTLSMVDAGPRWPGLAAIAALGLLLALQLLLAQRAALANQPQWRPTLERVCGVLGCSLPAWREPEAFAMVTRSVRPSPVHPGVLEITATFRNDAAREQAWPVLLLGLSDIHGQTVGARAFQPAEYRDQRTTGDTLSPGQTVTVLLDVVEPAPDTVAFSFDFR